VFRLNEAASDAAANLSVLFAERGVTVMIPGNLPSVTANRIQVTQVLQSLMSNAVSHNPDPVQIGLEARREETLVRMAVSDTGTGIAPENQQRIFEPFKRLNHDNHHCGLGLAIAQKIVEAHGGKIGCDSIPGEGASFHFTLPGGLLTVEPPVIVAPAASRSGVESETLANVLFVDDSEAEIELAQFYLTASDGMRCNLLIARDGKEGLAMIRDQESRNDPVDLVLLDINMPVMNGFQMLEAMAKDAQSGPVPVVICSGSSREEDKSRAHALGAIAYLVKTVRFAQLEPVIADVAGVRLIRDEEGARSLVRVG
jgi:two-component system CheB/CheR fusion protein